MLSFKYRLVNQTIALMLINLRKIIDKEINELLTIVLVTDMLIKSMAEIIKL